MSQLLFLALAVFAIVAPGSFPKEVDEVPENMQAVEASAPPEPAYFEYDAGESLALKPAFDPPTIESQVIADTDEYTITLESLYFEDDFIHGSYIPNLIWSLENRSDRRVEVELKYGSVNRLACIFGDGAKLTAEPHKNVKSFFDITLPHQDSVSVEGYCLDNVEEIELTAVEGDHQYNVLVPTSVHDGILPFLEPTSILLADSGEFSAEIIGSEEVKNSRQVITVLYYNYSDFPVEVELTDGPKADVPAHTQRLERFSISARDTYKGYMLVHQLAGDGTTTNTPFEGRIKLSNDSVQPSAVED